MELYTQPRLEVGSNQINGTYWPHIS